jgi:hypothetical protein
VVLAAVWLLFVALLLEGSARLVLGVPRLVWRLHGDEDLSWRRRWMERHRQHGAALHYAFDVQPGAQHQRPGAAGTA